MISKFAIDEFLEQEMEDWFFVKDLSQKELKEVILDLTGLPSFFKMKPYKHQLACYLLGLYCKTFLFFPDMGMGKTAICLGLLQYYKQIGEVKKRALVVVPNAVNVANFIKEIHKHSGMTVKGLTGERDIRLLAIAEHVDINVINYDGLKVFMSTMEKVKGKKKGKYRINKTRAKHFLYNYDFICLDEIHLLRNRKHNYDLCKFLCQNIKYRYGLTGTPFGRDLQALFAQFYLIDRGRTLGKNITFFREAFMTQKTEQIYTKNKEGEVIIRDVWKYVSSKKNKRLLKQRIKNRSIRYKDTEAVDLPKRVDIQIPLIFPSENLKHYNKALQGLIEAKGDYTSLDNAFTRLRQITSGFFVFKNEDDERIEIEFKDNPKLERLVDLIQSSPEDTKVVVFNWFVPAGQMIKKRLQKEKINSVWLYGKTKKKEETLDKFLEDKDVKVLNVNIKTGSLGLNLQEVTSYLIYYDIPVSPFDRKQSLKRIHRIGQTKRTFIYDLIMKGSIDEKILGFLKEGRDLFKAILEDRSIIK